MKKFILGIFLGVVIAAVAVLYIEQERQQTQPVAKAETNTNTLNKFRRNQPQTREDLNRQLQNKIAQSANDLMQAKTPQDMLKAVNEIIKLRPEDPNLYLLKSQILKNQGKLKEALEEINKAIFLDPKNPNFYRVKGEIEFENKDFRSAERNFTAAAQLSGKADNYYNRAITNLNLGNYQAANLDFKKAQELYNKEGNLPAAKQSKDISTFLTKNIPAKPQSQQKTTKSSAKQNTPQNNAEINKLIQKQMPQALKHYSESESLKDFQELLPKVNLAPEVKTTAQANSAQQNNTVSKPNPAPQDNAKTQHNTMPRNNLPPVDMVPQQREEQEPDFEPQTNLLPEDEKQMPQEDNSVQEQEINIPKITKKDIFKGTPVLSMQQAESMMANKDYAGAKAVLDDAIDKFPDDDRLYLNRAQANFMQGNHKGAIKDLDKALEINPDNYSAAISKGDLYGSLGQNEEAKSAYRQAANIAANNGNQRGVDEAQTKYQLADGKEITSKTDERFTRAANAYANKDYNTAAKIFEQIYSENPTPENAFNLGLAYKGQGDMEAAFKMLSITADNKQENFEVQMVTSQVAMELNPADHVSARKYLDRAKEIANETGITNPDMWALSAQINSSVGDHDSAAQDLRTALDGYNQQLAHTTDPEEQQRINAQIANIEEYLQQFENN